MTTSHAFKTRKVVSQKFPTSPKGNYLDQQFRREPNVKAELGIKAGKMPSRVSISCS